MKRERNLVKGKAEEKGREGNASKDQEQSGSSSMPLSKAFRDFVSTLPEEEDKPWLVGDRADVGIIDQVFARAAEVLESPENAINWLISPNYAFRGKRPIDFLFCTPGSQAVLDELGRLRHGIPS